MTIALTSQDLAGRKVTQWSVMLGTQLQLQTSFYGKYLVRDDEINGRRYFERDRDQWRHRHSESVSRESQEQQEEAEARMTPPRLRMLCLRLRWRQGMIRCYSSTTHSSPSLRNLSLLGGQEVWIFLVESIRKGSIFDLLGNAISGICILIHLPALHQINFTLSKILKAMPMLRIRTYHTYIAFSIFRCHHMLLCHK